MAFAFTLIKFLLFSTFTTFLLFPIATSTPVTSLIAKPPRFVANLKAKKSVTLNRLNALAHLVPYQKVSILAEFSIGEPPIQQLAIVDTGSSLTWLQCKLCDPYCHSPVGLIFNPSKSSTYSNLPCSHGTRCKYYMNCTCNLHNQAEYTIRYGYNSASRGILATEQFVFKTSEKITFVASNIIFGCSQEISNSSVSSVDLGTGIIGMNAAPSSLTTQMGGKFSYCIGSLTDWDGEYSQLIIGEGANILGDTTPFTTNNVGTVKNYYIQLESISIDGKPLDIDMARLKVDYKGNGGVIVDSGTTLIHLDPDAFFPLANEVRNRMSNFKFFSWNTFYMCCEGKLTKQVLKGFPAVTFQFASGAELVLEADSMFLQGYGDNTFCMSVALKNSASASIIGLMAQQHYNVGYDLKGQIISFYRVDCKLLYQ